MTHSAVGRLRERLPQSARTNYRDDFAKRNQKRRATSTIGESVLRKRSLARSISPREHVLMRRLTDGGLERAWQIERTDFYFSRHCLKCEVAVEVFLNKFDQGA